MSFASGKPSASSRPIIICLDNNDYSDLSNPRKQSAERDALRDELIRWAESVVIIERLEGDEFAEVPISDVEARYEVRELVERSRRPRVPRIGWESRRLGRVVYETENTMSR